MRGVTLTHQRKVTPAKALKLRNSSWAGADLFSAYPSPVGAERSAQIPHRAEFDVHAHRRIPQFAESGFKHKR
jgi:hypothetical protein